MVIASIEKPGQITIGPFIDNLFTSPSASTFGCVPDCPMKSDFYKMLIRPWFIGILTLVAVHQIMQKVLGLNVQILDSFLDPLLFMPILLHLILWEHRFLLRKGSYYVLSWKTMIVILFFVSILCEYFFPRWNNSFTRDYLDIFCYAIGTSIFGLFLNKPAETKEAFGSSEKIE